MRLLGLVLALTCTLVALAADAQQGKVYRVGLLLQASPPSPGPPGCSLQPCVTSGMSMDRTSFSSVSGQAVRTNAFPLSLVSSLR